MVDSNRVGGDRGGTRPHPGRAGERIGGDHWFRISALADGARPAKTVLHCADSYALSGAVSALAAAQVSDFDVGAHWLSHAPDPLRWWADVSRFAPSAVVAWPSVDGGAATGAVEEGEL